MRLVSAYYQGSYPFHHLGIYDELVDSSNPADLQEGDHLVVWGGADISPALYGKEVSKFTGATSKLSPRDAVEWAMMQRAKTLGCTIIGICRGGQMLTALAGGYLIQHVNGHGGYDHPVILPDGKEVEVNSIHHQMMQPGNAPHEMLAKSKHIISKVHFDVNEDVPVECEPEYIYYPGVKGHAIQWHPEMMHVLSPATKFIFNSIKERL